MVYTVNPAPLFVNWSVSPTNKDLVKRNPDAKDLLLRTIRDSFYAGIMGGIQRNGKQNDKMERKRCRPFPTNSLERDETPINRPDNSFKK